ncbi:16S rRNA (guanine(527)-N(7))-methyltransferase RsmG [Erythrobacter sp. MTPC3]|uniref:16S rRNA (guanine(527)-N(7))-methyltransferase RsmG n=1 Tax=Erythrobacter sp. MTPC3 TaxID=3056564 RepID=UPI0036F3AC8A
MDARRLDGEDEAQIYVEGWGDKLAMDRLNRFIGLLLDENKRQNLVSKPSVAHMWKRHIADSAQLLRFVSCETSELTKRGPWLDLGTGAGLPGLVIAILRPDLPVKLVESRARRVEFLAHCIEELDLKQCTVLGERLERVEPFEASVISARAFAPLEKLVRLSAPFSTKGTTYLLPKGRSAAHELNEQKASIRRMFHVEQSLTDDDAGIIVSAHTRD